MKFRDLLEGSDKIKDQLYKKYEGFKLTSALKNAGVEKIKIEDKYNMTFVAADFGRLPYRFTLTYNGKEVSMSYDNSAKRGSGTWWNKNKNTLLSKYGNNIIDNFDKIVVDAMKMIDSEEQAEALSKKKMKYTKLWKLILSEIGDSIDAENAIELYNTVVDEYEEMEDNPNDATIQDVYEIKDASGL